MRVEDGDLVFVTSNEHKFEEAQQIATEFGLGLVQYPYQGQDIQSPDVTLIAEAKARAAFAYLHRALFVDQTSLHLTAVKGFPAGYTPYFLHCFGDDAVCRTFGASDHLAQAQGRTTLAYCDGQVVKSFVGTIDGRIVHEPRGDVTGWDAFGWNRVFAPTPGTQTFAEMGVARKNEISMRRAALELLFEWVRNSWMS